MKRQRTKEIEEFILSRVADNPRGIARLTAEAFGISRQAVNQHLQDLVGRNLLEAKGATRSREYALKPLVSKTIHFPMDPKLAEDRVWRESVAGLLSPLPANVEGICHYGFTEMFNNVLDHAAATEVDVKVETNAAAIELWVVDNGVGIFSKISKELGLEDERHAILELSKGKVTTDPEHHTGEGIFFTSRMFDHFCILSGHLFFGHSEPGDDWLIEDTDKEHNGTSVSMQISRVCSRTAKGVFNEYAPELDDFGFTRTHVPVNLLRHGKENLVSRSQAKRLLARFEKFNEVFLDFEGVDSIGQAFADEIFRVFRRENPDVKIVWVRASPEVEKMIRRALVAEDS